MRGARASGDVSGQPRDGRRGAAASETGLTNELLAALEAVLLVAEEPVPPDVLASVLGCTQNAVTAACELLAREYEAQGRGFALVRVAGGYRYQTAPDQADVVERFILDGAPRRLSPAALETLAIVAYRQPVSHNQVADIRGINSAGVIRTLRRRGYIDEVARAPGPGQAVLYGTTPEFLQGLGLDSLHDLPPLGDFVPDATVVEALERQLGIPAGLDGFNRSEAPAKRSGTGGPRANTAERQ